VLPVSVTVLIHHGMLSLTRALHETKIESVILLSFHPPRRLHMQALSICMGF
jgi:hypothetical protein